MRYTMISVMVGLLATATVAQVSTDEAQAKLKARQEQRARERAELVTMTRGEMEDLRAQIRSLTVQRDALQRKLAEMTAGEAPATQPAVEKKTPIEDAIRHHEIIPGMTVDEVDESLLQHGQRVGVDESGREQWKWKIMGHERATSPTASTRLDPRYVRIGGPDHRPLVEIGSYFAIVRDGKVVSYQRMTDADTDEVPPVRR